MTREELMLKAKEAKSAEELLALAKENGMEMNEESAVAYFEVTHKTGELADDELDNVAGGRCYKNGRPVVAATDYRPSCFECSCGIRSPHYCQSKSSYRIEVCGDCRHCSYEKGLWLCNNPEKMQ